MGLKEVVKSLEPIERKICTNVWRSIHESIAHLSPADKQAVRILMTVNIFCTSLVAIVNSSSELTDVQAWLDQLLKTSKIVILNSLNKENNI